MICLFENASNIKTNDDFRKVIKRKNKIMLLLIIIGGITILAAGLAALTGLLDSDSYLCGLYFGLGTGLILAGIMKLLQHKKILYNEELLKRERLKYTDERNQAIAGKAVQTSLFILLFLVYMGMLIGVFYSRTIFYCYWSVIIAFLLLYSICTKYYTHKM
jgi:hypothetical protein